MIWIRKLTKTYPNGFKALDNVNLHIGQSEFVYLVGQSGAGKSTLLNMIFRADIPSAGDIVINRFSLNKIKSHQVPFLRRNIGVIFQDYKLLPKRTVYENVAFALRVMHQPRSKIKKAVTQVLELVGLQERMNRMPQELSGGEQQRICIARAIVNNPPILLADEPTGNLDPDTAWDIMQLLAKINNRNTPVLVATHSREIVDGMRKRVVALEGGQVIRDQQLGVYEE